MVSHIVVNQIKYDSFNKTAYGFRLVKEQIYMYTIRNNVPIKKHTMKFNANPHHTK